ncbi:metal-dependent hydrolase [Virgibacillus xinjiangensis]|uniref:Metal-dependent hydrolase n=1 Tax=Virgibacillus xinjiangensis TaxID=393090 RepID=A0ABV7CWS7_9BACI
MRYDTHLITSLATGTGVTIVSAVPFTFGYVIGIMIGSLLPDIDEPQSFIGRRSFGVASVIKRTYGHRGITHSLFAWLIFSIVSCLIAPNFFGIGLSLGYLFHIIGDLFSVSGVPLYKPFTDERVKMPRRLTYRTSSQKEKIILSIFLLLLILLLPNAMTDLFVQSFSDLLDTLFNFLSFALNKITTGL